jgi:hypothetical protein
MVVKRILRYKLNTFYYGSKLIKWNNHNINSYDYKKENIKTWI